MGLTKLAYLNVGEIHLTGHNPNGRLKGPDFEELVEDVRRHGVLQPVLVRPRGRGKEGVELIAGHRRLEASRRVGLILIPTLEVQAAEGQDAELRIVENLHRKGLTPVAEAQLFLGLTAEHDPEEIATRVGKSAAHVRRRLSLLRLPAKLTAAVEADQVSLRVAELVASIDEPKSRAAAAGVALERRWGGQGITAPEMRRWILDHAGRALEAAPWKLGDAELVTSSPCSGPCTTCTFNSKNQADLFGDDPRAREGATCLNAIGWQAKMAAYLKRRRTELEAEGGRELTAAEAKKIARNGSAGQLVAIDKACYEDPQLRSYRQLIGSEKVPVAVGQVDGQVVEAVSKRDALAAARKRGVKLGRTADTGASKLSRQESVRREKSKVERAAVVTAAELLVAKAEKTKAIDTAWLVISAIRNASHEQQRAVCARRGLVPEKRGGTSAGWSPRSVLEQHATTLTLGGRVGLIVELTATPSFPGNVEELARACKVYRVDWPGILRAQGRAGAKDRRAKKATKPKRAAKVKSPARAKKKGGRR
jgi:ParB/RepB/Spo0J family partition protein